MVMISFFDMVIEFDKVVFKTNRCCEASGSFEFAVALLSKGV